MASGCLGSDCQGCADCPELSLAEILGVGSPFECELWSRQVERAIAIDAGTLPYAEVTPLADPMPIPWGWDDAKYWGKNTTSLDFALLILGVHLRYNLRAHRAEWRMVQDCDRADAWRELNDRTMARLREVIAGSFIHPKKTDDDTDYIGLEYGRDKWQDTINALLYRNEVDPFRQWLETLPAWDGEERLRWWIMDAFEGLSEDYEDLAAWAGQFLFLGAVWRTFRPGVKQDETPVLIGAGGIGKSTALAEMLPTELPGLFGDALHLAADNKSQVEALQGKVLVEISEMVGSTRADVSRLKAFLSRVDDGGVRLAYRRDPEMMRRRCIFAGTADVGDPLPNDRNLRRFVPVELPDGNPVHVRRFLNEHRTQLWAEAVSLYRQGVEARLPDALKESQSSATAKARNTNETLEDAITQWIEGFSGNTFRLAQLASGLGLIDTIEDGARLSNQDQRRITRTLHAMGYERITARPEGGGKPSKVWAKE